MILFVECVILCVLFTIPLLIMSKNPLSGINNYPPAIIRRVRELGLIDDTELPSSKKVIARKLITAIFIAIICALIVYFVNGARSFWEGFATTYLIWTVVNWYDAIVIDWIWFCHDPRFVIPGTEDMVKDYHDYWFHAKASLKGMLIGLPVALAVGGLVALCGQIF
ncbi:MAG: hypothetical protein J1E81_07660 [Eubacterium sp.]|nr:hypothetical protein [Eubacterium sp.]